MNLAFPALWFVGLLSYGETTAKDKATDTLTILPAAANGHAEMTILAEPVAAGSRFTKRQTAKRLFDHGYTSVAGLTKDGRGVWHCTAIKNGSVINVSVDSQGSISK